MATGDLRGARAALSSRETPLVLVVDDDPEQLRLVTRKLAGYGYRTLQSDRGEAALELFQAHLPNLVLLDALMPGMDGFQLCRAIKALRVGREIPVIMVTGLEDDASVEAAFGVGAEEYVAKPIRWVVLRQRIRLLLRTQQVELERLRALDEIRRQHDKLAFERHHIENIIQNMRRSRRFSPRNNRVLMAPVESTTGDILLSMCRRDGVQHILVGDFTGHGLPAAIGGPMVAEMFYTMTEKGHAILEILGEINDKLFRKMPTFLFMAACCMEIDYARERVSVWNGGFPEVLIYGGGQVTARHVSREVPMGILDRSHFKPELTRSSFKRGERLFAFSDGIVEVQDRDGHMLGMTAVEALLARLIREDHDLQWLETQAARFRGGCEQADDITVVEVIHSE